MKCAYYVATVLVGGLLAIAPHANAATTDALGGVIKIDGSSTVYPITEAVAEEFGQVQKGVKVTVGISGTGGGFKKFCAGETDISDASRPIKQAEIDACKQAGIQYIELPISYDALTVVVNPKNTWATSMTVAELKKLWEPEAQGKITRWNQIRSDWPDQPIALFGPGVDSGTYDYFTEVIVGKEHSSRGDFTSSEDDNVLVQGVSSDVHALGFFGMSYYEENTNKLRAVLVDDEDDSNGKGPQMPSAANVIAGTYKPLARPLFIYVRLDSVQRPEIHTFVEYYLQNAPKLTAEVGYVPLSASSYPLASQRFQNLKTGSIFDLPEAKKAGMTLDTLLRTQQNS